MGINNPTLSTINCTSTVVAQLCCRTILHYLVSYTITHLLTSLSYAAEQSYNILFYIITDPLTTESAQSYNSTPVHYYPSQLLLYRPQYSILLPTPECCTQLYTITVPSPDSIILHSRKQSFAPECYPPSTILHSHNNPIMLPPPSWPCHQHKYNANRKNPMIMLPPTIIALC